MEAGLKLEDCVGLGVGLELGLGLGLGLPGKGKGEGEGEGEREFNFGEQLLFSLDLVFSLWLAGTVAIGMVVCFLAHPVVSESMVKNKNFKSGFIIINFHTLNINLHETGKLKTSRFCNWKAFLSNFVFRY